MDGLPDTRTLRETGGDAPSTLPSGEGGDNGQMCIPSHPQLDPTHETGENNPLAKLADRKGLVQPSGDSSIISHHHLN